MSILEDSGSESAGKTTEVWAIAGSGLEVGNVPKHISSYHIPQGASVRSLQAAAQPDNYNLHAIEYRILKKHAELIRYEQEAFTLADVESSDELSRYLDDDLRVSYEPHETVFVRHTWYVPSDLPQSQ